MAEQHGRVRIDPSTNLPDIHGFDELSQLLRSAVADEESRQLSESLSQVAGDIEVIIQVMAQDRSRARLAPLLMDLLDQLREHHRFLARLSVGWQRLYEYSSYGQALKQFRGEMARWLLEGNVRSIELPLSPQDFQLAAWRLLADGALLLDLYEHQRRDDASLPPSQDSR